MRQFLTQRDEGEVCVVNGSWPEIMAEAGQYEKSIVEVRKYERAKEISLQMIRWWKGVLLPALSKDTGDSLSHWETRLKLAVDPEYFKPFVVVVNGLAVTILPSIANMPMKKAIELVDGSVTYLHEQGFMWVQPPDITLRVT